MRTDLSGIFGQKTFGLYITRNSNTYSNYYFGFLVTTEICFYKHKRANNIEMGWKPDFSGLD